MDKVNTIIKKLNTFRDERNWKQFHTPQNLAKSIVLEASELLENYQYVTLQTPNVENVKEELADVMAYCLMMIDYYGFDFETMMHEKIDKNAEKYPAKTFYGNAKKYNDQ